MTLAESIRTQRLATPTISLIMRGEGDEKHVTLGTGVNFDPRGLVMTAEHVVGEQLQKLVDVQPDEVEEKLIRQKTATTTDGSDVEALLCVVFYAPTPGKMFRLALPVTHIMYGFQDDVCVLVLPRIAREDERVRFDCARFADSQTLCQGDEIASLGYPFGESIAPGGSARLSATAGIVSAVVPFEGADPRFYDSIQMDMLLNPGNSGGPVFLRDSGLVLGIVSHVLNAEAAPGEEASGIAVPTGLSFAVPEHRFREGLAEAIRLADSVEEPDGRDRVWVEMAIEAINRKVDNADDVINAMTDDVTISGVARGNDETRQVSPP